jgi:hypothetical protein
MTMAFRSPRTDTRAGSANILRTEFEVEDPEVGHTCTNNKLVVEGRMKQRKKPLWPEKKETKCGESKLESNKCKQKQVSQPSKQDIPEQYGR